jgi:hypothetical protein
MGDSIALSVDAQHILFAHPRPAAMVEKTQEFI